METSALSRKIPSLRRDRHMFSTSDDTAMVKQIMSTHAPDGREIEVKPILHIVEDILLRANAAMGTVPLQELPDERARSPGHEKMLEALSFTISQICCEITYKCSVGGEAHATTVDICNLITYYSWDAKVVLAMAAFAVNYGEFWLVAHLYATNPLAKGISLLKQLPELLERADLLKPRFEALDNLIRAMLEVAKCIVEFGELPPQYISTDDSAFSTAVSLIPTAVYWNIRSIVSCTSQILGLVGMGHEFLVSTTEAWELSGLAHKVSSIHSHLSQQLNLCHRHVDEKRHLEAYQTLVRLFETTHVDSIKILKALIYAKDDILPLFDGTIKSKVSLDVLRRKTVLLLISHLDMLEEDIPLLEQLFNESRQHSTWAAILFELLWIPVIEPSSTPWDEAQDSKFESLRASMPWYSVHHPSIIEPAVVRYIKEVWRFNKRPLVVVLDPQGKVTNPNAMHMIFIWGSIAFPFSRAREEALWREETWRIELLADSVDPNLLSWLGEGRHICLYGGEDMDWIRKFTTKARDVAKAAHIILEMLYVGKSNPGEKIRKNISAIVAENLSEALEIMAIWFFWKRLESMWYSKVQQGSTVENDPIMSEVMRMLSFDSGDKGWAVISSGAAVEMTRANGEIVLKSLDEFSEWKVHAEDKGFIPAMIDHINGLRTDHHCSRLILPGTDGSLPDRIVCAECGRQMEKLFMYRCCID